MVPPGRHLGVRVDHPIGHGVLTLALHLVAGETSPDQFKIDVLIIQDHLADQPVAILPMDSRQANREPGRSAIWRERERVRSRTCGGGTHAGKGRQS